MKYLVIIVSFQDDIDNILIDRQYTSKHLTKQGHILKSCTAPSNLVRRIGIEIKLIQFVEIFCDYTA